MKETKFKHTEVGMIPSDWEVKKISQLCDKFLDGDWIEADDQSEDGFRLIQTGNVGNGRYLDKASRKHFISESTFKRLNCTEIFAGDVLVSRLPDPVGRACILPKSSERRITAVDCTIIHFANYNPILFVNYTQTEEYQNAVNEYLSGSTRLRISRKNMGEVLIPVPSSKEEQQRIANALSDVDSLIANLEKLIAKKKNIKQGAMQSLLTGKKRLKGFDGEWCEKKLGQIGYLQNGYAFNSDSFSEFGYNVIRISDIQEGLIVFDTMVKTNILVPKDFEVKKGDFLIAMSGATTGKVGKYTSEEKSFINQRVGKIVVNEIDNDFVYWMFNSVFFTDYLNSIITAGAQPNISKGQIEDFCLKIPPTLGEQRAISKILSDMDLEIDALEQKLAKMRKIKQGMMQELLTGKIRLV